MSSDRSRRGTTRRSGAPGRAPRPLLPGLVAVAALAAIAVPAGVRAQDDGAAAPDVATSTATSTSSGSAAQRPDEALTVVDQAFEIPVDGRFEIAIALPTEIDPTEFDARSLLVVTSHRSIADRAEMHGTLDGELTRTEDTFDISLDPAVPDPNLLSIADGVLRVSVPTESVTRTPEALQLAQSGVHPIVFELRLRDRPTAEVTTYVHRLPSVPSSAGPLSVSLLMRQMTLPDIGIDGAVQLDDNAEAELDQLAQVLAALDAAPAAAGRTDGTVVPRGVLVEPSLVRVVVDTEPELAASLLPGLASSDLIAAPRLPLDPSAARAAGEDTRYGDWLRQGEDELGAIVPNTEIDRSIAIVDDRISGGGAELQRTLGARLLVLPWDFYTDLDGSLLELTDISQLVTVRLPSGDDIPAAIIDDFLGNQMVRGTDEPLRTAVEIVAELVVLARDLDLDGRPVAKHGVMLALPDLGIPDPAFVAQLGRLLVGTSALQLVDPRTLGTSTNTLLVDGRVVELDLPDSAGPDLTPRIERLTAVSSDVLAYASMLPTDAPRIAEWSATLDALASTAMNDADADAAVARLDGDFADLRAAIVPPEPFSFTLTGSTQNFRFPLTNTSDTELTVRIQLSSPKIRFPDGDRTITLPPGVEQTIVVDAEALSNGKSSVFLRIYAPGQNRDVELVPEVVLTARVNSLAGVGQLATGAGLLLVLAWWAHHTRTSRRKALAQRNVSRHPSASAASAAAAAAAAAATAESTTAASTTAASTTGSRQSLEPAPVGEVSPDAAASSIPPS